MSLLHSTVRRPAVRLSAAVLCCLLVLGACTRSPREASLERRTDTLSQYEDGTPEVVTVTLGDSVLERRTYRSTGRLSKIVSGDSVQTYLDLHDPDSAAILKDYLQGRWRNLSADTSQSQSSAFYVFDSGQLTFENPSRTPLESIDIDYKDNRTLVTQGGMSVEADIASFDTVRVTGYTLVRLAPPDSLP